MLYINSSIHDLDLNIFKINEARSGNARPRFIVCSPPKNALNYFKPGFSKIYLKANSKGNSPIYIYIFQCFDCDNTRN